MFSFGLLATNDMQNKSKIVGYSMPFVLYDLKKGMQLVDKGFLNMIEGITKAIREMVSNKDIMQKISSKRRKEIDVDSLTFMKTSNEKPDAPPAMFVKLRTEYNTDPPKITMLSLGRQQEVTER